MPTNRERIFNSAAKGQQAVASWEQTWAWNLAQNVHRLCYRDGGLRPRYHDFGDWTRTYFKPAILCSSGPSLDDIDWPLVKAHRSTFDIYATPSNGTLLLSKGIYPTYLCGVDSNATVTTQIKDFPQKFHEHMTLLAPPTMDPGVFDYWKGQVVLFRPHQQGHEFIEKWVSMILSKKVTYFGSRHHYQPQVTVGILNTGCVGNAMILLAAAQVHRPILLFGFDLAYTDGQMRSTQYEYHEGDDTWIPKPLASLSFKGMPKYGNTGQITDDPLITYKQNMFIALRVSNAPVYTVSERGIVTRRDVPFIPFNEKLFTPGKDGEEAPLELMRKEYILKDADYERHLDARLHEAGLTVISEPGGFIKLQEVKENEPNLLEGSKDGDKEKQNPILLDISNAGGYSLPPQQVGPSPTEIPHPQPPPAGL
jgi:hypothetical protein